MQHIQTYESPLGELTFVSDGTALLGVWYEKQEPLEHLLQSPYETCNLPVFDETRRWFDLYFDGREPDFTPPLHPVGTDFRQQVWNDLLLIPYGETTTYGALAQQMVHRLSKSRMSAQAIGGAVGHNPLSIIVPCHRVVGADGTLTGYAGGIWRKEYLLNLEAKSCFD